MDEVVRSAEANRRVLGGRQAMEAVSDVAQPVTDAISYTAVRLAEETQAEALCCLTHSGSTARAIASHRPGVPIYAFTDDATALGRIALTWGVEPIAIEFQEHTDDGIRTVHQQLLARGDYDPGTRIVITAGLPLPAMGLTNMVHVSSLGEDWV
jgi:pyruvate kinase